MINNLKIKKKEFNVIRHSFLRDNKEFSIETGKLAVQADSSIVLRMMDNALLFTTCMSKQPDLGRDFMPLMIDFRESYSASGRIAGAVYRRREGRPSENNVLYARLTDRALRPMFPKGMINDVVVSITPFAIDHNYELDVMTIIGSSLSVMSAGVPFDGPVGAVQIGYLDGNFIINPSKEQVSSGLFNLLVAGKKGSINMIECGAKEVPADLLKEAFVIAQEQINLCCDFQKEFLSQIHITKQEIVYNKPSESVIAYISNIINEDKLMAMTGNSKVSFNELFRQYEKEVLDICKSKIEDQEDGDFTITKVKMGFFNHIKDFVRNRSLSTGNRIDNRTDLEIRDIYCEVSMCKRNHGSGLFRRGDTQVLTTTTLGGPMDYLLYDDMENNGVKQRYFHHYNFPPFSVGEAQGSRGQNRREIGHGKLAEKAIIPVLPDKEIFPYCIRTVSECLGSGGSTSMGSVCGSTLSLMDAGVPITYPVAGIAMGLIADHTESGEITNYMILNDLQGVEDFFGDMDFKVAGTKNGITAIQLDTKLKGLNMDIIHQTMDRSFEGYCTIMDFMLNTIDRPRDSINEFAPKIVSIKVATDKIKDVIGKGGEMIDKIIQVCNNIKIDFEEDGTCFLTHTDQKAIDKAIDMIKDIVEDLEIGKIYQGEVSRIEDYGIFINLPKKKSGLCHISNLGPTVGNDIKSHFKIGDKIKVKIISIDEKGRINVKKEL